MNDIYEISTLRVINSQNVDINESNGQIYSVVKYNGSHYELVSCAKDYNELLNKKEKNIKIKLENGTYENTLKMLILKVQKEILNPMETAFIYQEICEFTDIKQSFLSDKVNKTQGAVSNKLRLLKLPRYIQNEIFKGNLKERHGRAILQIKTDLESDSKIKELVNLTVHNKWKVSELEEEIDKMLNKKVKRKVTTTLKELENKRSLNNREALLSINQFEKDIDNSLKIIQRNLPNIEIEIEKGISNNDYIININLKDINKEI